MVVSTKSKFAYLTLFGAAYLILTLLWPASNIAVMKLFPEAHQAIAIAASCVIWYTLGEIPAPVVLGWLKDSWAPRCRTVEIDGESKLNPECPLDRSGLRMVLLFPVLWLTWAVGLWGVAKFMLKRQTGTTAVMIESPMVSY